MYNIHRKIITLISLLAIPALAFSMNKPIQEQALNSAKGYSDVSTVTLEVGKRAPDFSLVSLKGESVSLNSLQGQKAILVFYRGHWCPFCLSHLEDIQVAFPALLKRGYQVIAISPDGSAGMQKMADKMNKPYTFLSDPNLKTIEAYGIRKDKELPHPAVVLLNDQGLVQWFYVGENYQQRPSATQIKKVTERVSK